MAAQAGLFSFKLQYWKEVEISSWMEEGDLLQAEEEEQAGHFSFS